MPSNKSPKKIKLKPKKKTNPLVRRGGARSARKSATRTSSKSLYRGLMPYYV